MRRYIAAILTALTAALTLTTPATAATYDPRIIRGHVISYRHTGAPIYEQGPNGTCTVAAMANLWNATHRDGITDATFRRLETAFLAPNGNRIPPGGWDDPNLNHMNDLGYKARRVFYTENADTVIYWAKYRPVYLEVWIGSDITDYSDTVRWRLGKRGGEGHAVTIIGVNTRTRDVLVLNSWGIAWGANGTAWLSYRDLKRNLITAAIIDWN